MNINLALASLNPTVGDLAGNTKLIIEAYKQAAEQGADILLTPEMSLTGYPIEDLTQRPAFLSAVEKAHAALIHEIQGMGFDTSIIFGHPTDTYQSDGDRYLVFNSITLFDPTTEEIHVVHKRELPNYGVFDEKRNFLAGDETTATPWRGHKLGLLICEDGWKTNVVSKLQNDGAEILLWPNGSPFAMGKNCQRIDHANRHLKETGLPIAYVNLVGNQDELLFDGQTFAFNGSQFVSAAMFTPTLTMVEMPLGPIPNIHATGYIPKPKPMGIEHVYRAQVLAVRDYARKQGFTSVVLGMSGGIDSAIAASICVDAIGPDNVHLVRLPSRFSSGGSLTDAAAARDVLGAHMRTIEIEPVVNNLRAAYLTTQWDTPKTTGSNALTGLADENLQARARGVILMAISNQEGHMLITTGNKSEVAVGYATLYGDMCGGFNPLKDSYKTEISVAAGRIAHSEADVAALSEAFGPGLVQWRNSLNAHQVEAYGFYGPAGRTVPLEIEIKAESAELSENQKDSDSLPRYPILDGILRLLVDHGIGTKLACRPHNSLIDHAIIDSVMNNCRLDQFSPAPRAFSAEDVERVNQLVNRAEYKRRQSAPGPKIAGMLFGRDRRMPITNAWKE